MSRSFIFPFLQYRNKESCYRSKSGRPKITYPTHKDAAAVIRGLLRKDIYQGREGRKLQPYKCSTHRGWHIGHGYIIPSERSLRYRGTHDERLRSEIGDRALNHLLRQNARGQTRERLALLKKAMA